MPPVDSLRTLDLSISKMNTECARQHMPAAPRCQPRMADGGTWWVGKQNVLGAPANQITVQYIIAMSMTAATHKLSPRNFQAARKVAPSNRLTNNRGNCN